MKYRCYATVMAGKYLGEVEADSEDEAKEKAWELDTCYVSFCHQCADQAEDPEITEVSVEVIS